MRILEIGCGPGAAAREIARHLGDGHILAIDRSPKAVMMAKEKNEEFIKAGVMSVRQAAIENFRLSPAEDRFDIAFAIRVGVLDGRHPAVEASALARIAAALKHGGRLFIDGGDPLRELPLRRAAR